MARYSVDVTYSVKTTIDVEVDDELQIAEEVGYKLFTSNQGVVSGSVQILDYAYNGNGCLTKLAEGNNERV